MHIFSKIATIAFAAMLFTFAAEPASADIRSWYQDRLRAGQSAQDAITSLDLSGDYTEDEIVGLLTDLADEGDVEAQFSLGYRHSFGMGVEQDYARSAHWYEKAAQQGHSTAMFNLGVMHFYGSGVDQDYKQAIDWYDQAARQGNADAQFILGTIYERGAHVDGDAGLAHMWFSLSSTNGFAIGEERSAALEASMSPSQVRDAEEM